MKILKIYLPAFILLYINIYGQSEQLFANIGDYKLDNGQEISNCIIGYRTYGKINEDSSNVIIYCSWFGGTSEAIGGLIEKRNFVDTAKYFIIAFDALGNGVSSSPSNYNNDHFPEFSIRDMVNTQYLVLTEHLGINKLYGAIGGSMGSMQVLEWAVAYPSFLKKIIAYVSTPRLTSFDLLWMHTQLKMIETLRKYDVTEKEIKILSDMMTEWISRSPEYVNEKIDTEDFQSYLATFHKETPKVFTMENYTGQMKAMLTHDISKDLNYSMEEAAKIIKAELLLIVSQNDMMVNPEESIRLAELTGAELIILDNNCGHLAVSCELERIKEAISIFLNH